MNATVFAQRSDFSRHKLIRSEYTTSPTPGPSRHVSISFISHYEAPIMTQSQKSQILSLLTEGLQFKQFAEQTGLSRAA